MVRRSGVEPSIDGLLLIDKPSGPTSHDIVGWVRRAIGQRRVGHSGTLDPAASGLLLIALGRATRLIRFLPAGPKVYTGTFLLGQNTDTDDLEGEVIARHDGPLPVADQLLQARDRFLGRTMQRPPAYSARKVDGERLYKAARKGKTLVAPEKPIDTENWSIDPTDDPARWSFEMTVSGGTYVRSLVRDLGAALGCGATLATLRRTAIGPLSVDAAIPPPERGLRDWRPPEMMALSQLPLALPEQILESPESIDSARAGRSLPRPKELENGGFVALRRSSGELLAIAECNAERLQPRVVVDPA